MNIEIPDRLLKMVPQGSNQTEYLLAATEVGLRAMSQANLAADTTVVSDAFEKIAADLMEQLTGPHSEIRKLVEDLFGRTDSPFHEAMDPSNPKSKVSALLELIDGRNKEFSDVFLKNLIEHEKEVQKNLNEMKEKIGINLAVAEVEKVGTKKGFDFEGEITEELQNWQKYSDSFENVGHQAEGSTKRKVGDVIATMDTGDSIVIEVKAGKNYSNTGDDSLDRQMDEAMAYRGALGSIAVTTLEAMETKKWQHSMFLDRGKNRIIVAVDREGSDFTMLKVAYMLLRERIVSQQTGNNDHGKGVSTQQILERVKSIEQCMSSIKKLRQIMSDIEGRFEGLRTEITNMNGNISTAVAELYELLGSNPAV